MSEVEIVVLCFEDGEKGHSQRSWCPLEAENDPVRKFSF